MIGLPGEQYPNLTPLSFRLKQIIPVQNAITVEESVASPLEQQINQLWMLEVYMKSTSTNDGSMLLTFHFSMSTDPDMNTNISTKAGIGSAVKSPNQ